MAEAVVSVVLENIKNLLIEEASLSDVRHEINGLSNDLELLQSILRDFDGREVRGETIRHWVREIKTLCYGIEDVLEFYNIKVESQKGKGIRHAVRRFVGFVDYYLAVRQVKSQIGNVRGRFTDLSEGLRRYGVFREVQDPRTLVSEIEGNLWLEHINVPFSDMRFVGMMEDIETLVSLLVNEGANYQVISLCGMRGSGKTALAFNLYNHSVVKCHFEGFAWVHLTQAFQTKAVLEDILKQLLSGETVEEVDQMDDIELAQKLYKVQHEKKCLVVLDDIRSVDAWESLRIVFPFAETTSKIILTTRIREVMETLAGVGYIHTMKSLTEKEGWELFKRKAFLTAGPDFQVHGMRKVIGKGLVRRCRGNPLAINMLGALMASKRTLHEWEMVYQDVDSHVKIGEITAIHQVLVSSFIDLPYDLKPCFLYLGYFPENSEIEVEKLYLLWMAEGIIVPRNLEREESTMKIAEDYLENLRVRSLVEVQEEEVTTLRRFKSCRINGLMRELCLSKGKEEEFVEVIDLGRGSQGISDSLFFDSTNPLRRLVVYLDNYKDRRSVPFVRETAKYLRFLLVYNAYENQKGSVLPEDICNLSHFRVLRVLDFDGVDFRGMNLPWGISKLELLRYLSFKGCFLTALPEAVGRLSYLQILDLRVRNEMIMPNVLWKIKRLRYLYLPQKFQTLNHDKLRLDSLTELETLKHFSTKMCNVENLQKLTNLRYLAADTEGSVEDLKGLIDRMNMTTGPMLYCSLDVRNFDCYTEERHSVFRQLLRCDALHTLSIEGLIRQIPSFNKISKSLTEIIFSGSRLKEDPMLAFRKLPNLRVLVLNDDTFLGGDMVCPSSGFPELRRLELLNLCSLKNWRIENGALAKLSTLTFENCRRLETVPNGLEFITNLAKLNIRKMPQTFQQSIGNWKVGKDLKVSIHFEN